MGRYTANSRGLYTVNNNISYTRTHHAENQSSVDTFRLNKKIEEIHARYVTNFRLGKYSLIGNDMNTYLNYYNDFKDTIDDTKSNFNICHKFVVDTMTAVLQAKNLSATINIKNVKIRNCEEAVKDLNKKVKRYERIILDSSGASMCNNDIIIEASAKAEPINLLVLTAQHNIYLAWYYFLFGYDQNKAIDPDNFNFTIQHVNTLGVQREERFKNQSMAFMVLLNEIL